MGYDTEKQREYFNEWSIRHPNYHRTIPRKWKKKITEEFRRSFWKGYKITPKKLEDYSRDNGLPYHVGASILRQYNPGEFRKIAERKTRERSRKYKVGRRFEFWLAYLLEDFGYNVWGPGSGSRGRFDIHAVPRKEEGPDIYIQLRINGGMTTAEKNSLIEFAFQRNGRPVMATKLSSKEVKLKDISNNEVIILSKRLLQGGFEGKLPTIFFTDNMLQPLKQILQSID